MSYFKLKCTRFDLGWGGGVPDPAGAGYSAPQTPAGFQGASALETFVIIALYKSTFTIPYHTILLRGRRGERTGRKGKGWMRRQGGTYF